MLDRLAAELEPEAALVTRLGELITTDEIEALRARVAALRSTGLHREPSGEWPAIPWPPV